VNQMSGRKVLVTGGAGFLGSALCERLVLQGNEVTCLDSLLSGRIQNLETIWNTEGFRFLEGDVRDGLPESEFAEIWNLACPASPPLYQIDPVGTLMTNVVGMHAVLERARQCGARVFQASTSEIYGDPDVHPQPESYRGSVSTTGPRACYDEGKRAAEALCFDFHRKYGVEIKVARIFNTYGPRMDAGDGRVVSNFIVSALRGLPLQLYGDGSQTRSFCYRDDLIDGFLLLMAARPDFTGPVNLGNPVEFSIRELAELVVELTHSSSPIQYAPLPTDDPRQRKPDISLARAELGWAPPTPLVEGLKKTIAYFEASLSACAPIAG
jgi:UDP-glucuronate decarboxylase